MMPEDFIKSSTWSNEDTMKRYMYLENIIVPFISEKRKALKVDECHPALVLFDCFWRQTTTEFHLLLQRHNICFVQVPPNYTDRL